MMGCVDDNTLALFVQGLLPADRIEQVERHVDRCPDCTLLLVYFGRSFGQGDETASRERAAPYRVLPEDDGQLPAVGSQLGRYAIVHRVGSGGMGVVFTAFDPTLNRRVAIKLVRPDSAAGDPAAQRNRMLREARAMARLAHPNVLAVFDVGSFGEQVFIAMELVEGVTLGEWLALENRSADAILDALRQAGSGLSAAHQAGIVHGDFKPANVLVGVDARVRVMDFGLARADEESPRSHRALDIGLASTSHVGGTLAYMAPEQLTHGTGGPDDRIPTKTTSAWSDQYAFCVVLYEALYGQRPFSASTPETLLRSQVEMRPGFGRRTDVPDWLPAVLSRGLEPTPDRRFAAMADLLEALEGEEPRRAFAHVRANAVLLCGMWVIHVAWSAFVIPIMVQRAMEPTTVASATPDASALDSGAAVAALVLLGWIPMGLIGAPINAVGLLLRKGWARLGTLVYALLSLPTCIGTPFAIYALWTMTRPSVRKHVFDSTSKDEPSNDPSRDARIHIRTNAFVQLGMWVVHAVLMALVIPLLVHMLEPLGDTAPKSSDPFSTWESVFLSFMALVLLFWVPLGSVWTAINALGLWRNRRWARWSTLGYAVLSLPTGLGTPAAAYALWSLSRRDVVEILSRTD